VIRNAWFARLGEYFKRSWAAERFFVIFNIQSMPLMHLLFRSQAYGIFYVKLLNLKDVIKSYNNLKIVLAYLLRFWGSGDLCFLGLIADRKSIENI